MGQHWPRPRCPTRFRSTLPDWRAVTRQLFIYWKTDPGQAAAAMAGMSAFQRALQERHAGLVSRLYRRADESRPADARVTLMETYASTGGITAALQDEIVSAAARASAAWCQGQRHVEAFDQLPPDVGGTIDP